MYKNANAGTQVYTHMHCTCMYTQCMHTGAHMHKHEKYLHSEVHKHTKLHMYTYSHVHVYMCTCAHIYSFSLVRKGCYAGVPVAVESSERQYFWGSPAWSSFCDNLQGSYYCHGLFLSRYDSAFIIVICWQVFWALILWSLLNRRDIICFGEFCQVLFLLSL
jgi:hypothetical protein